MGEMVDPIAMWMLHRQAAEDQRPMARWSDVPEDEKGPFIAARDLVVTLRPTLGMRVKVRAGTSKRDEGETWRVMIDGALHEEN